MERLKFFKNVTSYLQSMLWGLTEVIGAGSSLCDLNKSSTGWDVKDLVVTEGNCDILEASSHLPAGGVPPTTDSTSVDQRVRAQHPVASFGLSGGEGKCG